MKHLFVHLLLSILTLTALSQEFSQWRGLNRDGKYPDKNLLKEWPESGPNLLWSYDELGAGHSSVAIANNHVYITGMPGSTGMLYCFDLLGNLQWKKSYGPEWTKNYPGTRSAPAVKGSHLYIESGRGRVVCLDANNGQQIWSVDLLKKFNARNIQWGMAESILLHGDLAITTPGGPEHNVVALNRFTGETIWSSPGNGELSAYCSPQLVHQNGTDLVVTMTINSILGIDANDGTLYWSVPQTQAYKIHANTPLFHKGNILCISGSNENTSGTVMLKLSEDGKSVNQIWRNNNFEILMGGFIHDSGYIFGSRYEKDVWFCLDWQSGEMQYTSEDIDSGVIIWADGLFYCYSTKGEMALVDADKNHFNVISMFMVRRGSGPHWSHPVIADGRLYLRHGTALMVYDISK